MFTRTIRPTLSATRRVVVAPTPRYSSFATRHGNDPEILEQEKQKNLRGEQHSAHKHAPGWNELLASDSEANVKADKAEGSPEEMASSTIEYVKKKHPNSWSETIQEHTSSPSIKDTIDGPLGALGKTAKKAADALAEAAATLPEDAQGTLSDKGARAEQARRASHNTASEDAVKADRAEHQTQHH